MRYVVVLCWTVLLLTLLAAADGCGRAAAPPAKPAAPAAAPSQSGTPAEATAGETWTCPMHPEVKAAVPGKCPICKMDLVPAKPDAAEKTAAPSGEAPK